MWYPGKKPKSLVPWLKKEMAKQATTHNNQTVVPNNKIHNGRKKLK